MKVLVACEESQAVTIEFRRLGHEAQSCDILDQSGGHPEWHIKGDALELINGNCSFMTTDGVQHTVNGRWDMLIAFPPCTYLSNAGACRLYPKKGQLDIARYEKGLEAKEFFLRFLNADCPRIAVENPVSSKVFEMPPPLARNPAISIRSMQDSPFYKEDSTLASRRYTSAYTYFTRR